MTGGRVLDGQSLTDLLEFAVSEGEFRGHRMLSVSGWDGIGFGAHVLHLPDEALTVVALCNLNVSSVAGEIARGVAALALGDALALAVCESRGFSPRDFARYHPGGRLGRRLLTVADLMHAGEQVPSVPATAPMAEAVAEMSRKGLGMTCVVAGDGVAAGSPHRRGPAPADAAPGPPAGGHGRRGRDASEAYPRVRDFN